MPGVSSPSSATNYSGGQVRLNGNGFIAGQDPGIVTVGGVPGRRRIDLYDKQTGRRVQSTVSDNNGGYRFENLNPDRRFFIIAFDHELRFNAVIRDNIRPAE